MKRFVRTSVAGSGKEGDARRPNLGGLENQEDIQYSMYDEEPDDNKCMARVTAPENLMDEISAVGEARVVDDEEARKVLKKHTPHADLENLDQPGVEVNEVIDSHDPQELLSREKQLRVRIIQEWTQEIPREKRHNLLEEADAKHVGTLVHQFPEERLRQIAEEHGLTEIGDLHHDTSVIVRSAIALPSRGNQVLQDQEFHAIRKAVEVDKPQRASMPEDGHVLARGQSAPKEVEERVKAVLDGRNREHQELVDYIKERNKPDWIHEI